MTKKRKVKVVKWKISNIIFAFFLLVILGLYAQYCYLSLSKKVYGEDIKKFAAKRNSVTTELVAERGKIYDVHGDELAINVSSYNVIAYLNKARDLDEKHPQHVINKEETAQKLSEALGADYNYILERLNSKLYQVQFGNYGRNITELKKIEIEKLKLPGIDFEKTTTRYYPKGNFASQILGYAKADDKGQIVGLLGIESKYNKKLKGINGYYTYQQDNNGYKIPDTPEEREDAIDGEDIYLTIDSSIQRFIESSIAQLSSEYEPEWALIEVMDAKTGAILGSGTTKGFDPNNIPEDMSYENPLVSYAYEPGSTMKIYAYMCAIDKGVYDGNTIFHSGSYKVDEENTINDWKPEGWGDISYDVGFEYSSNVGIANIVKNYLSLKELKECQQKYGFGKKTDISLSNELAGALNYKYPIEVIAAGYGQGILTTPIQHLQALSIIANDGYMVTPRIISKVIDKETNEEKVTKVIKSKERVAKSETVNKMKELMSRVVTTPTATGYKYNIEGFDIIGKTGTAQIYENGKYLTGDTDYITSVALMYPKDDPQVIVYAAIKKPNHNHNSALNDAVKSLVQNIAKYQGTFSDYEAEMKSRTITLKNYEGQNFNDVMSSFESHQINTIKIGDKDIIINQYPLKGNKVTFGDKVFLLTSTSSVIIPDMTNWSRNDVKHYCKLAQISCEYEGNGYVVSQTIPPNTLVSGSLKVILEERIKE